MPRMWRRAHYRSMPTSYTRQSTATLAAAGGAIRGGLIHGALCSGYHDEGSVFESIPCFERKQQTRNQQTSSASTTTNNGDSSSARGGSRCLNTTTAATGRSTPLSRPGRKLFYKVGDLVQRNGSAAWVTDAYPTPLWGNGITTI
jgi:hypothetical protein